MIASGTVLERIRRFDAYPKTLEDFRVKTYGGATVTVVSGIIMFLLFVSELNYYLTPELNEELLIDVSRNDVLRINIDITFPHVTCSFLTMDAIDTSGDQHMNIDHNVFKRRLNEKGEAIDKPEKDTSIESKKSAEKFVEDVKPVVTTLNPDRCESCYGAETLTRKCCNTCEDVRDAYNEKGWAIRDIDTIAQCHREGLSEAITNFDKEGCQIFGYVEVSRVGGNFHIAPGKSSTRNHVHVHNLNPHSAHQFNMTHSIKHLSFGRNIPHKRNPLDETSQVASSGSMMYQYYVKIVPTMYSKLDGQIVSTNQYAVTRHEKEVHESLTESGLPGVFFIYEFGPMMVKYTEHSRSLMQFITSVCAIIGGVFTVAGMIDSMLYHSVRAIQKKIQLGKTS